MEKEFIARNPSGIRPSHRMGLSVEDPLVQRDDVFATEEQEEIFQRLGEPEALHRVSLAGYRLGDIVDGGVAVRGARSGANVVEHAPAGLAPVRIAGDAVHVVNGFNSFGSI